VALDRAGREGPPVARGGDMQPVGVMAELEFPAALPLLARLGLDHAVLAEQAFRRVAVTLGHVSPFQPALPGGGRRSFLVKSPRPKTGPNRIASVESGHTRRSGGKSGAVGAEDQDY